MQLFKPPGWPDRHAGPPGSWLVIMDLRIATANPARFPYSHPRTGKMRPRSTPQAETSHHVHGTRFPPNRKSNVAGRR
jgi:hypothetical protein